VNIFATEIQYLEQRNPLIGVTYSFFFPGLGQLYNHRFGLAFYAIFWWWIYLYLSGLHASLLNLLLGNLQESIAILHPHWLLFMPSVMGGSIYQAFVTTNDHNQLFRLNQQHKLQKRYRGSKLRIFP
jgi:hypothetical protein